MPMFHSLRCCMLKEEEHHLAKALIYETYWEEMGWFPSPIIHLNGSQGNDFGGQVFRGIHLDGGLRRSERTEGSEYVFEDRGLLCEASRLAVRKTYRHKGPVFLMLLKIGIQAARANGTTLFAANAGRSLEILRKYATDTGVEFKYEERDPSLAKLPVIDVVDMENVLENISKDTSLIVEPDLRRDNIGSSEAVGNGHSDRIRCSSCR